MVKCSCSSHIDARWSCWPRVGEPLTMVKCSCSGCCCVELIAGGTLSKPRCCCCALDFCARKQTHGTASPSAPAQLHQASGRAKGKQLTSFQAVLTEKYRSSLSHCVPLSTLNPLLNALLPALESEAALQTQSSHLFPIALSPINKTLLS